MKPWLKKIDAMKAEALAKANRLTAERFRKGVVLKKAYEQAVAEGKSAAEATMGAVEKSGLDLGHSSLTLRGWFLSLSLDESEDDGKWRWRLSASKTLTFGAICDSAELKEIVERLGGKFDDPDLTPERDGTRATHWRWDHAP